MENLYMIENKYGKLVQFKPNKAQIAFFKNMHVGGNIILKARQLGMSTGIVMWILNELLFSARKTAGIVDKTLTDAEAKIRKVLIAYENMDNPALEFHPIGALIKSSVKITSSSSQRIEFSNGSSLQAGRSLRGGTVQFLHISELGKIAMEEPKKAEEVLSGALNTIAPGNYIFAESTHEGGRVGLHYKLLRQAMENDPDNLSPVDMKFHFYPWFYDPAYSINPLTVQLRKETIEYFEKLEQEFQLHLTPGQIAWYDRKSLQQQEAMLKEYPSTPGEAFEGNIRGAIYAKYISEARASGRIIDFTPDPNIPVICAWDIGVSDFTSIWAIQLVGREIHWVDWYEGNNMPVSHYASVIREWDKKYNTISHHYLPHDAGYRDRNASSYVQYLAEAGITNVTVVPRTPDVWIGINHLRDLLKRSVFHLTNCGTPRKDELGDEHPSGLDCLEAYRTGGVDAAGRIKEIPIHDETSHSCDSARTFAEAMNRGMVGYEGMTGPGGRRGKFRFHVITGGGGQVWSDSSRPNVKVL